MGIGATESWFRCDAGWERALDRGRTRLGRRFGELAPVERVVKATILHQSRVATLLDDVPVVHHNDGVRLANR